MGAPALAIAIAVVHALGIVFLIAGAPAAAFRPRLMRWYLLVLAPTAAINLAGQPCPLTVWEKHFWRQAGETPYRGGFVSRYIVEPFHAPGLQPGDETIILIGVVVWCLVWLSYAAVRRLRRRASRLAVAGGAGARDVKANVVRTDDRPRPRRSRGGVMRRLSDTASVTGADPLS